MKLNEKVGTSSLQVMDEHEPHDIEIHDNLGLIFKSFNLGHFLLD
jgi:hypothetical protein